MPHGFAVSFIRLLFNNSEEVKRIRFSQTGFVWVVIALLVLLVIGCWGFVCLSAHQALPVIHSRRRGAKRIVHSVLRVIGSSEQVHVVDALATTGDEGRCSLR